MTPLEKPRGKRATKFKGAEAEAVAKTIPLVPLNNNQKLYIDALKMRQQIIVLGPSGTGKTYIAATYAANLYVNKKIDRIVVTRPAVSVGKSLGALPGTMEEKFGPWLSPVLSVLEESPPLDFSRLVGRMSTVNPNMVIQLIHSALK